MIAFFRVAVTVASHRHRTSHGLTLDGRLANGGAALGGWKSDVQGGCKCPDYARHVALSQRLATLSGKGESMKALLMRSLIAAVIMGPVIAIVSEVVSIRDAKRYQPPVSQTEMAAMRSLPVNQVEAVLRGREVKVSRWEWLTESVRYSYFWKQVAETGIAPGLGFFLACIWVGWMEKRYAQRA